MAIGGGWAIEVAERQPPLRQVRLRGQLQSLLRKLQLMTDLLPITWSFTLDHQCSKYQYQKIHRTHSLKIPTGVAVSCYTRQRSFPVDVFKSGICREITELHR